MLAELREQFLAEFVATARSRIKTALALLPPVGPGGERSAETIERLMHTVAGEASMIGLQTVTEAARAAQAAAKRYMAAQGNAPLLLVGCARALRNVALTIDALKVSAPASDSASSPPPDATSTVATQGSAQEANDGPGRVLLVDDSPFNAAVLCDALNAQGMQAVAVGDNLQQALLRLAEHRPHVLLIDAIMPQLDPKDLCAAIREKPEYAGVRLLLFTALSSEEAEARARAIAADGVVTKDEGVDAVVARVRALLPGSGSAAATGVVR